MFMEKRIYRAFLVLAEEKYTFLDALDTMECKVFQTFGREEDEEYIYVIQGKPENVKELELMLNGNENVKAYFQVHF